MHPVVAGRLGDGASGRRAIIAGHVDVVGGGDELQWTTPPFEPRIADGLLYGRGACDMKAGVVAGLAALRALVEAEVELGGEAILLTVPGEEDGGAGMLAAIRAGFAGGVAVITEPTELQVVTAQAGAITFTLTIQGRSAHAAFRREGVSAIEKLWPIMRALEENERERNDAEPLRAMRELGLPYPTSIGRVARRRVVVDRSRPARRRGPLRRAGRPDVAEAEAELRSVIAEACAGDEWLRDHPADIEITGGRFAAASVAERPPAAVGPRRDGPRRPRPAARLPRHAVRRRRPPPDRPRRRRRPSSTAPATRTWPTPRTSTSRSRTSRAARACWPCGSCARWAETVVPGTGVSRAVV